MNLKKHGTKVIKWKPTTLAGIGLSGVGLLAAAIVIGQVLPPLLEGNPPQVSTIHMAIEASVSILFLMVGFTLLVVGSDPFEDVTDEFRFDSDERL